MDWYSLRTSFHGGAKMLNFLLAPLEMNYAAKTSVSRLVSFSTYGFLLYNRDPLNFCYGVDQARFDRLRFVEIKHGRIAMLAVVGHMATTAGLRLPGNEAYPAGLKALTAIPQEQLLTNIAVAGALDFLIFTDKGKGEFPGDLRNGMFKWNESKEVKDSKRAIELNNGRAAQMGILGLMFHEQMTGEPYVLNAFLGYPTV
jgi:hypothetical protein